MRKILWLLLTAAIYLQACTKKTDAPDNGNNNNNNNTDTTVTSPVVIKDQPDNGKDTIVNWSVVHHRDVQQLAAWTQLLFPAPDTAYLINSAWLPTSAFSTSFDGGKTWSDEHFIITNNEFLYMIDGKTGFGYRKTYGTTMGSDINSFYWTPTAIQYYRLVYTASGIGGLITTGISVPSRQFAYVTFSNGESVRLQNPFDYPHYVFNSAGAVPDETTDLFFKNNTTGWLCTSNGVLMETTDSSKTWNTKLTVSNTGFSKIYFFDDNNGWASSYTNSIYKTTDGGATWNKIATPGITSTVVQFVFTTKSRGFFIAGREVYETADGGTTWTRSCKMGKEYFQSITKQGNSVYVLSQGSETRTTQLSGGGTETGSWTFATILKYQ